MTHQQQPKRAPTVKARDFGIDHSARVQCYLAFDLTWSEVATMPVEHITLELPHQQREQVAA